MEVKFRAWDKKENKWINFDRICFWDNRRTIWYIEDSEENDRPYFLDEGEFELVQFTGLPDVHGNELYDQDIFEELDGTRWKIYYDNELLSWQVTCLNDERFSNQGLCEFIDRFEGEIRIDGLKKGNAFEHPHLLEGVK